MLQVSPKVSLQDFLRAESYQEEKKQKRECEQTDAFGQEPERWHEQVVEHLKVGRGTVVLSLPYEVPHYDTEEDIEKEAALKRDGSACSKIARKTFQASYSCEESTLERSTSVLSMNMLCGLRKGRLEAELEDYGSNRRLPDGEIASMRLHMADTASVRTVLQAFALLVCPNEFAVSEQFLLGST